MREKENWHKRWKGRIQTISATKISLAEAWKKFCFCSAGSAAFWRWFYLHLLRVAAVGHTFMSPLLFSLHTPVDLQMLKLLRVPAVLPESPESRLCVQPKTGSHMSTNPDSNWILVKVFNSIWDLSFDLLAKRQKWPNKPDVPDL